jgi:predicted nucleotidyltransferase
MYRISFDQLRQGKLSALFDMLEAELLALNIDFYLIGAVARDVWLTALHNIEPGRITRDLDLAVLLANKEQYRLLKQQLIATGRFTASRDNVYTLVFDDGRPVDLLPFGAVAMEDAVRITGT